MSLSALVSFWLCISFVDIETGLMKIHYLKNMVVDPNGQISVSYVDASGKTIATALAGITPPNMHSLSSNNAGDIYARSVVWYNPVNDVSEAIKDIVRLAGWTLSNG